MTPSRTEVSAPGPDTEAMLCAVKKLVEPRNVHYHARNPNVVERRHVLYHAWDPNLAERVW